MNRPQGLTGAAMAWAVVLLSAVYCFGFVDRQIFSLLVEQFRRDFGITDLQAGALLGPAFIASYVGVGLIAGWCVDRFDRRNLLLLAGIGWSVGTIGAAFASGYGGLIASRLVVGAAEAFLFPGGLSLIADLVDKRRLPMATSLFLAASPLGSGIALLGGGLLLDLTERQARVAIPLWGDIFGWQLTLLIVGLVGLVPVLLLVTLRDPARGVRAATAGDAPHAFRFLEACLYMARRWRFYFMFFLGMACISMVTLTIGAWAPTLLMRGFGLSPAQVGLRYGLLALACGLGACILSPIVSAWIGRHRPHPTMDTVRLAPFAVLPCALLLVMVRSEGAVTAVMALLLFTSTFPITMASASLQLAAPPRLRGMAASCYFVVVSLLGYGLGPTAVPLVAAHVLHDPDRLGGAIAIVAILFAGLSILFITVAASAFAREHRHV